jgi:tubulin polyglutamylase TTLL11
MKDNNINKNDYYIPCYYDYDNCENKIKEFENVKENKKIFIIDGSDIVASKLTLWEILESTYGSEASNYMPTTFLLHDEKAMNKFPDHFNNKQKEKKNHMFVLKNYAQRQEGIKLCNNLNEILDAKNNGYYLVQDYLYKPYLIDNRKVNLRYYTLIVCKNGIVDCYIHRNGFVYYTPDYYDENKMDFNKHITTGYIDRKVYEKNPLTLEDFRNHLDQIKKDLSKIFDSNIRILMNNIMKVLSPHICKNKKLSHHIKFQIFGSDIAITENLDAYLMEINKGPDLEAKDERDKQVKLSMQRDIFKLIENNNLSNNLFEKIY